MSYLFYIDSVEKIVLRPEALKLKEELRVLSDKEIYFIIMYCDYHSPYHQLPEIQRRNNSIWEAFGDNVPNILDKPKIKAAIEAYTALQYNDKIELINRYRTKLDRISQRFLSPEHDDDSPQSNTNLMKTISQLREAIRELEQEVSQEMKDEGQIKGDSTLSWLENMQANSDRYDSILKAAKKRKDDK